MARIIFEIQSRVGVTHFLRNGMVDAICKTSEGFEIDIGVVGPIAGGLLADWRCASVYKDLYLVDRSVCAAAAVGS